ncbi:MAG: hypothetical protein WC803_08750 [Sphingomonas sp.]|jgi:hypothetical protein
MPVLLPSTPGTARIVPQLVDFGSIVTPPLGGEQQRLNRLGNRWALTVQLPPMKIEPAGREWAAALNEGVTEGVVFAFPQVDFDVGTPGATLVNGGSQTGSTINLDGFSANYPIRKGQFFSVIIGGRRFLYQSRADIAATAGGTVALAITPMIRKSPADNAVCEFAAPMIEGFLQGQGNQWTVDLARTVGLEFTIFERA